MVVTRAKFYGAENSDGDATDEFVNGSHADPLTQSMLDAMGGVPAKADKRDAGGNGNGGNSNGGNSAHGSGGANGSGAHGNGGAASAAPTHGGSSPGSAHSGGANAVPTAHPITGTPNPTTTGVGEGNVIKGGRGGR